jgi:hypothetical protein
MKMVRAIKSGFFNMNILFIKMLRKTAMFFYYFLISAHSSLAMPKSGLTSKNWGQVPNSLFLKWSISEIIPIIRGSGIPAPNSDRELRAG